MNESKTLRKKRKAKYRGILVKYGPLSVYNKMTLDMMFFQSFLNHTRETEE